MGVPADGVKTLMKAAGLDPAILDEDPESPSPSFSAPGAVDGGGEASVPSISASSTLTSLTPFEEEVQEKAAARAARVKNGTQRMTVNATGMKRPDLNDDNQYDGHNDDDSNGSEAGREFKEDDELWTNIQTRGVGVKPAVIALKQNMIINAQKWLMHKSAKLDKELSRANDMDVQAKQNVISVEQNMGYFLDWMTRAVGHEVISAAASARSTDSLYLRVVIQLVKDPNQKRMNELIDIMMKASRAYTRYTDMCTLRCEYLRTFEYRKYEMGRGIKGPVLPLDPDTQVPEEEQYVWKSCLYQRVCGTEYEYYATNLLYCLLNRLVSA